MKHTVPNRFTSPLRVRFPHCVLTPLAFYMVTNSISASYQNVPGSNLGPEIDYPDIFHGLPQSLEANAGTATYIKLRFQKLFHPRNTLICRRHVTVTECRLTKIWYEIIHGHKYVCTYKLLPCKDAGM